MSQHCNPTTIRGNLTLKGGAMPSSISKRYDLLIGIFIVILVNIYPFECAGIEKTTVPGPRDLRKDDSSLTISEGKSTAYVPTEIKISFQESLNNLLFEKGKFKRGTGLKMVYSYIQFNPGNQAVHALITGGMGEGSIVINVSYIDSYGNQISNMQASRKISVGYPVSVAIEECAREIALYTEANILNRRGDVLPKKPDKVIQDDKTDGRDRMKGWWAPAR